MTLPLYKEWTVYFLPVSCTYYLFKHSHLAYHIHNSKQLYNSIISSSNLPFEEILFKYIHFLRKYFLPKHIV